MKQQKTISFYLVRILLLAIMVAMFPINNTYAACEYTAFGSEKNEFLSIKNLYVTGPNANHEVVYCFEADMLFPEADGTSGYTRVDFRDLNVDIKTKVKKVIYLGHPVNGNGLKEKYSLTDDQHRAITQLAVWSFTDNVPRSSLLDELKEKNYPAQLIENAMNAYDEMVNSTIELPSGFDLSFYEKSETNKYYQSLIGTSFTADTPIQPEIIPAIKTSFATVDGNKEAYANQTITFTDTINFTGLKVGENYTLKLTVMDKETNSPLTDKDGNPLTTITTFSPASTDGITQISITLDLTDLGNKELVAFEKLFLADVEIANHEDINDLDQTVKILEPKPEEPKPEEPKPEEPKPGEPKPEEPKTEEPKKVVPKDTPNPKTSLVSKNPKTSDEINLVFFAVVSIVSTSAFVFLRKNKEILK